MKGYDTADYARSRLVETVVRLKDSPVMVVDCASSKGGILVYYNDIMDKQSDIGQAMLDEFNLDPVPLGYVNHSGRATYLTRMPMRKDWRQGARMLNLVDPLGYSPNKLNFRVIGNTIMGKFPSLQSTLEVLNKLAAKPVETMAFSRDFAVQRDGALTYKGLFNVGKVDMENGSTLVEDKFNWTREALEEALEQAA